jgi:hypothetical protein
MDLMRVEYFIGACLEKIRPNLVHIQSADKAPPRLRAQLQFDGGRAVTRWHSPSRHCGGWGFLVWLLRSTASADFLYKDMCWIKSAYDISSHSKPPCAACWVLPTSKEASVPFSHSISDGLPPPIA